MQMTTHSHIKHVIFITPENRTYNHVLGYMTASDPNAGIDAVGGCDSLYHDMASINYILKKSQGAKQLDKQAFIDVQKESIYDTNAFTEKPTINIPNDTITVPVKKGAYPIFHFLAENYTVCDRWFSSIPTQTFPNRNFMIAATSGDKGENLQKNIFNELISKRTIFNNLDDAKLPWKIYHDELVSEMDNLKMDTFKNISRIVPRMTIIDDIKAGTLPVFSYIPMLDYSTSVKAATSYNNYDECCVGQIYNALLASPLWESSIIFIGWDEGGGFYDPVIPPPAPRLDEVSNYSYFPSNEPGKSYNFKFDTYGIRVPGIVVCPRTHKGSVDSTVYDHTSVLKFLEVHFGLPPLTNRDAKASHFTILNELKHDEVYLPVVIPKIDVPVNTPPTVAIGLLGGVQTIMFACVRIINSIRGWCCKSKVM
jgi:phospholipase C